MCNDRTQVLNEASALLFCSLQWKRGPFRCKWKEAGRRKSSHAVHMQSKTLTSPDAGASNPTLSPSKSSTKSDERWRGQRDECFRGVTSAERERGVASRGWVMCKERVLRKLLKYMLLIIYHPTHRERIFDLTCWQKQPQMQASSCSTGQILLWAHYCSTIR